MKKVLIILSFLIVIAAGATGTLYYYKQNKNQIEQNTMLAQQNTMIQNQLDAIGALTTVYEVSSKVYSGTEIKAEDLIEVSVPVSTLDKTSITDMTDLVGHFYKIDIEPGTILSTDVLMAEKETTHPTMDKVISVRSLPINTIKGSYIDIRAIMPNGEEIIIYSHKRIKDLYSNSIVLEFSEEENLIWNSVLLDLAAYEGKGFMVFVTNYINPGLDTDKVAWYPIQKDLENYCRWLENTGLITDSTRCINETMRDHIDHILMYATDSDNSAYASSFNAIVTTQKNEEKAVYDQWLLDHTDEEGNITIEDSSSSSDSFSQQVDEAYESLEDSIEDLEAIQ